MATRSTNTFPEYLERMLQDLSQAKLLADADLAWVLDIEAQIIDKYRQGAGIPGQEQSGQLPPGQGAAPMPGGMPPMSMAGGPPDMGAPSMMGEGGSRMPPPGMGAPNADELRRLLSQGG